MLVEFGELARRRAPVLAAVKIARFSRGDVDLGGMDILTLVRSRPAGFGGHGTMHGPVIGRLLAAMMAGRPDPTIDISSLRPHRPVGAAEE